MAVARDDTHWSAYNAAQGDRPPRPLCREVMGLAGPGRGRTAIDLGCGAGTETRALLRQGWRVIAVDSAPTTQEHVLAATADLDRDGLSIRTSSFADLGELPPADLVHAGYSLPYATPEVFAPLWQRIRSILRPGGWFAGNLFGDRDSWAGTVDGTFLTREHTLDLFTGMEVVRFDEEDEDGHAFSGPKHWHVFHVVARQPGADTPAGE